MSPWLKKWGRDHHTDLPGQPVIHAASRHHQLVAAVCLGKSASALPFDIFIETLGTVYGRAKHLADLTAYMLLLCSARLIEFLLYPKWGVLPLVGRRPRQ